MRILNLNLIVTPLATATRHEFGGPGHTDDAYPHPQPSSYASCDDNKTYLCMRHLVTTIRTWCERYQTTLWNLKTNFPPTCRCHLHQCLHHLLHPSHQRLLPQSLLLRLNHRRLLHPSHRRLLHPSHRRLLHQSHRRLLHQSLLHRRTPLTSLIHLGCQL